MLLKARMTVLTYAVLRVRHWLPGLGLGLETRGLGLGLDRWRLRLGLELGYEDLTTTLVKTHYVMEIYRI